MNKQYSRSWEMNNNSTYNFFFQLKKEGLPIALFTILGIVSENVSRLFIGLFISESILNGYIFAMSIILVLARITNGFSVGLIPRFTELNLNQNGKKPYQLIINSCLINEILLCLGAIIIFTFYEVFASLIFGISFSTITFNYINFLSISLIFFGFSGTFSGYFLSIGKSNYILYSSIVSSIFNIVIILSLGPSIGIYAVILGFIVSRSLIFYTLIIVFLKRKNYNNLFINIFLVTIIGAIFFTSIILLSNIIQVLNQFIFEKLIIAISSILILSSCYYIFKKLNPYLKY